MISKTPLISVIVPNYNHERFLKQRLESVFNQSYSNFEVILLDDCSTDNSRDVLSEYVNHPKVSHCVFNEINAGNTFIQWQKGILLAKGDLIWIAESDDFCELNFLEKVSKSLFDNKDVVLSYCQSNRVNECNEIKGSWLDHTRKLDKGILFLNDFVMDGSAFIEDFLIYKNVIPNASAVLIKKEAIDINKHFDLEPEFKYCGDWIFYFKLIANKKVAFVSETLNSFRFHSASVIARAKQTENRLTIIEIDYKVRKLLMKYLKRQNIQNFSRIKRKNRFTKRNYLTYEKAFLLVRIGYYFRGYMLLMTVIDVFFKKYKLIKNLKVKIKKIFKKP
ncbi:Glycosyltransferase involved in cell wall bisynthesis [Flavobacterium flevense]|uniref:Glycosyltransferase 2-like domain-containing protein n=1 Tax=Flavobacterium flevense TaxID=983 RepID=A0A4Y4B4T0_9FLAO|nr:glycosyltransferase [Flavobacterium flevense]GEC73663.1 hypothetical protein FFL01_32020 [Flavobacterium flevense]SHL99815.1 Glycosyltransferase involved in cell wall bisynthesis [Flavobacterium flevense]